MWYVSSYSIIVFVSSSIKFPQENLWQLSWSNICAVCVCVFFQVSVCQSISCCCNCVFHHHGDGHWTHATRNWSDEAGFLTHTCRWRKTKQTKKITHAFSQSPPGLLCVPPSYPFTLPPSALFLSLCATLECSLFSVQWNSFIWEKNIWGVKTWRCRSGIVRGYESISESLKGFFMRHFEGNLSSDSLFVVNIVYLSG